jgi:hypothetical protein
LSRHIIPIAKGTLYGNWKIISDTPRFDKWNNVQWLCSCSCGRTETWVGGHRLRHGLSTKCTRCSKEQTGAKLRGQTINIGDQFGWLTTISRSKAGWVCHCKCGKEHKVQQHHLLQGRVTSCGCNKGKGRRGKHIPALQRAGSAFRKLLTRYKQAAKSRRLEWELSEKEFRVLTSSPCYFTGRLPTYESRAISGEVYLYNGIDRLDNTAGYTLKNCVPCHGKINNMKKTLPAEEFIQLCREVALKHAGTV